MTTWSRMRAAGHRVRSSDHGADHPNSTAGHGTERAVATAAGGVGRRAAGGEHSAPAHCSVEHRGSTPTYQSNRTDRAT